MTNGIEGLIVETHNWGKAVAFWRGLGFELTEETSNTWGELRHPRGGPYLFVREVPSDQPTTMAPVLSVADSGTFVPPASGTVKQPFVDQHWGVREMVLADPDGRVLSVQVRSAKVEVRG